MHFMPVMEPLTDPEQGKMRQSSSEGTRAAVWLGLFVLVALVLVLGIGWGLGHRFSVGAPELHPSLPTLPGETPAPREHTR